MDLVHELCPLQLLEVTKKSDTWAGWLISIQHLAHIRMLYCRNMSGWKVCDNNQVTSQPLKMLHCFTQCVLCDSSDWKSYRWFWMGDWIIGQNLLIFLALSLYPCRVEGCNGVMVSACVWREKCVMTACWWCWQDQHNKQQGSYNSAAWPGPYLTSHLGRNVGSITDIFLVWAGWPRRRLTCFLLLRNEQESPH